jgi:hypothetical protein
VDFESPGIFFFIIRKMSSSTTTSTSTYERRLSPLVRAYPDDFQPLADIEYSSPAELEAYLRENVPLEVRYNIADVVDRAYADIRANTKEYSDYMKKLRNPVPLAQKAENEVLVSTILIARALRKQVPTSDPSIDYIIEFEYPSYLLDRSPDDATYESIIYTHRRIVEEYKTLGGSIPDIEPASLGINSETTEDRDYQESNIHWYAGDSFEQVTYGDGLVPLPSVIIEDLKSRKANVLEGTTYYPVRLVLTSSTTEAIHGGGEIILPPDATHYDLLREAVEGVKRRYDTKRLDPMRFEGFTGIGNKVLGRQLLYIIIFESD